MQVKIENQKLVPSINLLYGLSLKGKQSRHRTKFIKLLNERVEELKEQENELLKEHCNLDEEGKPKIIKAEQGDQWDVKDIEAFTRDKKELYEEEMVLEGGDAQGMLSTVKKVLLDCDSEWTGYEADIYDYLCEQFEMEDDK